jgi:hypothetical protein
LSNVNAVNNYDYSDYDDYEDYDPFKELNNVEINKYLVIKNHKAFNKNSGLTYQTFKVNDTIIFLDAENSIFSLDQLQTIKDLSVNSQEYLDSKGNKFTTLIIDTDIANELINN